MGPQPNPRSSEIREYRVVYCGEDELALVADPAGQGAVGFCGAVGDGVLPGAGVLGFGGVGADPDGPGFVPGFGAAGFAAELAGGMVPGDGTHGPLPGLGAGAGVTGGALPGGPGAGGVAWGVGVVWAVPCPAALVVIGVGGPIGFEGGGAVGTALGVGVGAAGTEVLGAWAGTVAVVGAAGRGGGVAGAVRWAATQPVQLTMAMSKVSSFPIEFPFSRPTSQPGAKAGMRFSKVSNSEAWRAIRRIP
ncbi:MAG TPA: hypothetical protein VMG82_36315 [Candidatus Sulfotelmatobacter sp.]|nr:hypothetical protein [Candidatus Sulfotelmatobacter sp.]